MTLKDFMETVNYRITEGSDYQWTCFGDNAYTLDSWNGDQDGHSVSVVFDTTTQVVYTVSAYDYIANRAYRWMNPEFVEAYKAECEGRDCVDTAWDDVAYTDLDVEADFLEKARAIVAGTEYDTRVMIPLDLDKDTMYDIMKRAHEADVTLNRYIETLLQSAIDAQTL